MEKSKKPVYDWAMIEHDYVTDPSHTYDSLGEKYGPRPKAISNHARKGNWKKKRSAFKEQKRLKTQEKLAEKRAQDEANEIERMNKAHYDSQQGLKYLADKIVIADVDNVKRGETGKLSVNQIQSLSNAQRTMQESQRIAKGLNEKEFNLNLVTQQLAPMIEKIVEVIQKYVPPETTENIILEFETIFGRDIS